MKAFFRAGTVVLAGAVASGCVVSVDSQAQIVREEKRFPVKGVPELRLSTFDGAVEIQSWEKPEILVEIEKRGPTQEAVAEITVTASQRDNRIELEAKRPERESRGFGFHVSTSARLIVSVPRRADIFVKTDDGAIRIERVNGRLELRTGDGSIRANDVSGELVLNTEDGSVVVDGAEGRLVLETGDGGVNVAGQLTAVRMHTGDGSVVYRASPGVSMSDDWDISTGDGSVSLYLPRGFSAELDAHTGDGSIKNDLDVVRASTTETGRRTVKGRLGDGGRRLRIRTGDGAITLKER
jgi:DUF4097 and DUF4098 domain-containing protein YvlB